MSGMMTRREFVAKGLTIVAAGATAPMFLTRTALALNNPWDQTLTAVAPGPDWPVLVVVQLGGGNDGLNTVVPGPATITTARGRASRFRRAASCVCRTISDSTRRSQT